MKFASCAIKANEYLKQTVTHADAVALMRKAHELMDGPNTATELCALLTREKISEIRSWMEDEGERNGHLFYAKLIQFFVDDYCEFKQVYDQLTTAKLAVDRAFSFRMHVIFTSADGTLTRQGLTEALAHRETAIRKEEKRTAEAQDRPLTCRMP